MPKSLLTSICILSILSFAVFCTYPTQPTILSPDFGNDLTKLAAIGAILLLSPIWAHARWKPHCIKIHGIPLDRGYFNYKSKGRPSATSSTNSKETNT